MAELQERRIDTFPTSADLVADLARTQFTLAGLRGDQPEHALPMLAEAVRRQRAALSLASAAQRPGFGAELAKYGTALVEAQVDQGDHAATARTVSQLEADLSPTWDGWPRVAGLLCRCVRLARDDAKLAGDARAQAARSYGDKALALLRKAVAAGRLDAATLRSADDWEPLRNGPEFREAFAQLIVDAEARAKGDGG